MKYSCELIRDLLPLYIDGACSTDSAEAVAEHLTECDDCALLCGQMKSCNDTIESPIIRERNNVIADQARVFKRRSAVAGSIIGGLFMLPVLICLIVDLAGGAGLSWSFIVLTAMFIPASLIVVPLLTREDKGLWTMLSFTVSVLTLLGVCCIYSGGTWFLTAASAVLFGLTLIFSPFIVRSKPVAERLGNQKALAVISADTITFVLMMVCIGSGLGSGIVTFFRTAAAFSAPYLAYLWGMFALIRFPKWNGFLKAASCILFSALTYFFSDTVTLLMLGEGIRFPQLHFRFSDAVSINDSVCWIVLLAGTVLAVIFGAIGMTRKPNHR